MSKRVKERIMIDGKDIAFTERRAWIECMKHWKAIMEGRGKSEYFNNREDLTAMPLYCCYLCEYTKRLMLEVRYPSHSTLDCHKFCPGALLNNFERTNINQCCWCEQEDTGWFNNPKEFYKLLKSTYEKYKASRKG